MRSIERSLATARDQLEALLTAVRGHEDIVISAGDRRFYSADALASRTEIVIEEILRANAKIERWRANNSP